MKCVFAIRDDVAAAFGAPLVFTSESLLRRELKNLVEIDKQHAYALNPADYVVFYLGVYYEDSGTFDLNGLPKRLFSVADLTTHE